MFTIFLILLLLLICILSAFLLLMLRLKPTEISDIPTVLHDERDVIYVRQKLQPGTAIYEQYYGEYPESKAADDHFRQLPGLLNPTASLANTFVLRSVRGSLNTIYSMLPERDGKCSESVRLEYDTLRMSAYIKKWCLHFGAISSGICRLETYHKYSHHGYYELRGVPVKLSHAYAIVFALEMDLNLTMSAPMAPIWLETARQYENGANIATQLAIMIRHMGWPAKAHYFDNYDIIAPLVARDAGLGEIGRMGILMTPEAGPRVRLAVVTTDLPLVPDIRKKDQAVLDLCASCNKCMRCCPAKAIPAGNPAEQEGGRYWRINHEACYTYWAKTGNPCGRCVAVCPLSHPGNLMARAQRDIFRRSALFQRAAMVWDDFRYGHTPQPRKIPDWIPVTDKPNTQKIESGNSLAHGKTTQSSSEDANDTPLVPSSNSN